ncbi:membrane protein [Petrotoga miotherma DSM 10691]|uniref:Membrane protein n=1 Tax=Petrotoga miotherma DSM 10691 TaxID=1434326 RepID=A0A2K1PHI9_9BACT|nr:YeeE/YedE family protein [Petrotoga miotherma]PNS02264.1 membrane protein [Petrotoga miotherma DSM 10691]
MTKTVEKVLGLLSFALILILGNTLLATDMLFFRLLIGVGFGYTLARAYTGFAGSVNRAYRTGSTQLMRAMIFMFFITSLMIMGFLFNSDPTNYSLWINPINFGLLLGAFLFGFGMSLSVCCATGVLTDLTMGFTRALITLIFFGIGVFLGFPIQRTAGWVTNSWITSPTGAKFKGGVFLPDLFKWDGFQGYLGAILLLAIFSSIVIFTSYQYEKKRRKEKTYFGVPSEKEQESRKKLDLSNFKFFSQETYNHIFVKPWTLTEGAVVLSILFVLLFGVTKAGWGASTPHGVLIGKVLMVFGVSGEALAEFTKMPAATFATPFFQNPSLVQNFGIVVGALTYLLSAGKFVESFKSELRVTGKEAFLYSLGGILMGFGTRFANGCNVGALYSPIAEFSLSGWIFLAFMILGAVVSNKIFYKIPSKTDFKVNKD